MVTGTSNCPFCEEEVYCINSYECVCNSESLPHWPVYEQYKCPHCGVFNMCIDQRPKATQAKLRSLQAIAAEENIQANQKECFIFWIDRSLEKAICNPEIKKVIKHGRWIVKHIYDF